MVVYDPELIKKYAQRLFRGSESIVISNIFAFTLFGLIIGTFIGLYTGDFAKIRTILMPLIVTGALGSLFGYMVGREKAFQIRLQCQQALCQVEIEKNTRKTAAEIHQPGVVEPVYAENKPSSVEVLENQN